MSHEDDEICCKLFDLQKQIPEFLIDNEKRAALCFRETLIICLKDESATDTKPIGAYCILVEPIGPQGHELLVHVQSSMSIDGHFGGSKVISSATEKFHCLEEKRTEFVYKDDGLHEKTMFIGIEEDFYHIKLKQTCPQNSLAESKDLSFCCNHKMISEGANVLLMRYLALINYEGSLSLQSITIDGEIAMSNYNCIPAKHMELDGHYLSVYTVERKMHKEDGTVNHIRTYLTEDGRILQHNWLDVPYILRINPLVDPRIINKTTKIETPLRERWSEDIEMLSKYLDMKSSIRAQQIEYLSDHPEIKHLIADYTQTLLVVKPTNVIDFTIQHFKAFAKDPHTWETSTLEETYDFDVQSQIAKEKSAVVCGVCGFCINPNIPSATETCSSSTETTSETIIPCDSNMSNASSKCSRDVPNSKQESVSSDTLKGNECMKTDPSAPNFFSQLQKACEECYSIVKSCQKDKLHSQCPKCLKMFSICLNCSAHGKILKKV